MPRVSSRSALRAPPRPLRSSAPHRRHPGHSPSPDACLVGAAARRCNGDKSYRERVLWARSGPPLKLFTRHVGQPSCCRDVRPARPIGLASRNCRASIADRPIRRPRVQSRTRRKLGRVKPDGFALVAHQHQGRAIRASADADYAVNANGASNFHVEHRTSNVCFWPIRAIVVDRFLFAHPPASTEGLGHGLGGACALARSAG